jgi:Xaa-Pro aminopeptidase
MPIAVNHGPEYYAARRQQLIQLIKERFAGAPSGIVLLLANFERDGIPFKQERSFYYLTGIAEPSAATVIDMATDESALYIPNFGAERHKWAAALHTTPEAAAEVGFNAISLLGDQWRGYQSYLLFEAEHYRALIKLLQECVAQKRPVYTLIGARPSNYIEQRLTLERLTGFVPGLPEVLRDCAPEVAYMRRTKTNPEIEQLYQAINITMDAIEVAARGIKPDAAEYEVQAMVEYMMTSSGASVAFPSIVGSGQKSTVLHYNDNNGVLRDGDVVVVDVGAEYNYYCADLTRTFPVSGKFTPRQREVYNVVLDTQQYIANLAKPGMYLNNPERQSESLQHLAQSFLKERGYAQYFVHGIGHFLGMDVHDVGDIMQPLKAGDIITIEPGVYIAGENIGVRIEDDYWIVPNGAICLSENLPRLADDIEQLMTTMHEPEEQKDAHEKRKKKSA